VFDDLDYYKILEVSPKALKNIIQNAYRTLAKNTPLIKDLQLK
jgi:DnaJ-class molecular chaperone